MVLGLNRAPTTVTMPGRGAGRVNMDLGDFGKKTILWGAGLSKNWGRFLADEFWGHLLEHRTV
jgi:hypothetical protein